LAGTIYKATHLAVFSIFPLLSAITVKGLISSLPNVQPFLNVTDQVSHPQL